MVRWMFYVALVALAIGIAAAVKVAQAGKGTLPDKVSKVFSAVLAHGLFWGMVVVCFLSLPGRFSQWQAGVTDVMTGLSLCAVLCAVGLAFRIPDANTLCLPHVPIFIFTGSYHLIHFLLGRPMAAWLQGQDDVRHLD